MHQQFILRVSVKRKEQEINERSFTLMEIMIDKTSNTFLGLYSCLWYSFRLMSLLEDVRSFPRQNHKHNKKCTSICSLCLQMFGSCCWLWLKFVWLEEHASLSTENNFFLPFQEKGGSSRETTGIESTWRRIMGISCREVTATTTTKVLL